LGSEQKRAFNCRKNPEEQPSSLCRPARSSCSWSGAPQKAPAPQHKLSKLSYSLLIPCFCTWLLRKPAIHAAFRAPKKKFPVIFPVIRRYGLCCSSLLQSAGHFLEIANEQVHLAVACLIIGRAQNRRWMDSSRKQNSILLHKFTALLKSLPSKPCAAVDPRQTTIRGRTVRTSASSHGRHAAISLVLGFLWIRMRPLGVHLKCFTMLVT